MQENMICEKCGGPGNDQTAPLCAGCAEGAATRRFVVEYRKDHPLSYAALIEADSAEDAEERFDDWTGGAEALYLGATGEMGGGYDDVEVTGIYEIAEDGRLLLRRELDWNDKLAATDRACEIPSLAEFMREGKLAVEAPELLNLVKWVEYWDDAIANDEGIDGSAMVEWFGEFHAAATALIAKIEGQRARVAAPAADTVETLDLQGYWWCFDDDELRVYGDTEDNENDLPEEHPAVFTTNDTKLMYKIKEELEIGSPERACHMAGLMA